MIPTGETTANEAAVILMSYASDLLATGDDGRIDEFVAAVRELASANRRLGRALDLELYEESAVNLETFALVVEARDLPHLQSALERSKRQAMT